MKTIPVFEMFKTDTLRNRSTALRIIEKIHSLPRTEVVSIDFSNVIFASRSFCHELSSGLQKRENVKFINMDKEVERMFEISRIKPHYYISRPLKQVEIPA